MKVILIKDVKGQGKRNDIIDVSDGYARNFLIKNGYAEPASASNVNAVTQMKKAEEYKRAAEKAEALKIAEKLTGTKIVIKVKVGETGKLFGALNTQSVADALEKQGILIDKKKIVLDENIKAVGEYEITIKPYAEVSAKIKLSVQPDK